MPRSPLDAPSPSLCLGIGSAASATKRREALSVQNRHADIVRVRTAAVDVAIHLDG